MFPIFSDFLIAIYWQTFAGKNHMWCGLVVFFFGIFSIVNPNNFANFCGNIQQIFDIIKMEKKKPTRVKKLVFQVFLKNVGERAKFTPNK